MERESKSVRKCVWRQQKLMGKSKKSTSIDMFKNKEKAK